jgi:hypothetical protein
MKRLALATLVIFALAATPLFAQTAAAQCPPGQTRLSNGQCVSNKQLYVPGKTKGDPSKSQSSAAEREKALKEKAARDKAEKERVEANKAKAKAEQAAKCAPGTHLCGKMCIPTSKSCDQFMAEQHKQQVEHRTKAMQENREKKANK